MKIALTRTNMKVFSHQDDGFGASLFREKHYLFSRVFLPAVPGEAFVPLPLHAFFYMETVFPVAAYLSSRPAPASFDNR